MLGLRCADAQAEWHALRNLEAALDVLSAYFRRLPRGHNRVRVWLSASYARAFIMPADGGAQNRSEALALAQSVATDLTGIDGKLLVWLDRWQVGGPCAAVAMPQSILDRLYLLCKEHSATLGSVKPWWTLALGAARAISHDQLRSVCWSLAEPDGLTLGTVEAGQVRQLNSSEVLSHDPQWTNTRRRALLTAGENVFVWECLADLNKSTAGLSPNKGGHSNELPIGAWTELSASRAPPFLSPDDACEFVAPSRPSGILWALPCAVVFGAIGVWLAVWWQAHETSLLEQSLHRLEARRGSALVAPAVLPPYAADARRAWRLGRFEMQNALTTLEMVDVPGIAISGIDVDADRNSVSVEFDAADFPTLGKFLDLLNQRDSQQRWSLLNVSTKNSSFSAQGVSVIHAVTVTKNF